MNLQFAENSEKNFLLPEKLKNDFLWKALKNFNKVLILL